MAISLKVLVLAVELQRADLGRLHQKVDSMMRDMRQQSLLVNTLVMTLKNTSSLD